MGFLAILLILQLALSIAGGVFWARRGIWIALSSALAVPAAGLLLAIGLAFAGEYQAESWARALPFVAVGMVVLAAIGAVAAFAAYQLKK